MITVKLTTHDGEQHRIAYGSVDAVTTDPGLPTLLDLGAEAELWCGSLRLTGRPIATWPELLEQLARAAPVVVRAEPRSPEWPDYRAGKPLLPPGEPVGEGAAQTTQTERHTAVQDTAPPPLLSTEERQKENT